jgi:hypothetical protein
MQNAGMAVKVTGTYGYHSALNGSEVGYSLG